MILNAIWNKMERGEPLYASEEKQFTEEVTRGIEALVSALGVNK